MKNEVSIDDKPLVLSVALADLPRELMKDIKSRGAEGKVKGVFDPNTGERSEERRVGKECRSRLSPYH